MKRYLLASALVVAGAMLSVAQQEPYVEQLQSVEAMKSPVAFGVYSRSTNLLAIASQTEKAVKIFESLTFNEKATLPPLVAKATSLGFSNSGLTLFTSGADGTVSLWGLDGSSQKAFSPHKAGVVAIAPFDEMMLFTVGLNKQVKLFDARLLKEVGEVSLEKEDITTIAVHPGKKHFALGLSTGQINIYAAGQFSLVKSFTDCNVRITTLAFIPESQYFVAGTSDGNVFVWDMQSMTFKTKILAHTGAVSSVAFDPKLRWMISSSVDGSTKMVDLKSWAVVKSFPPMDGALTFSTFLSDETFIGGTNKGFLVRWKILPTAPDTAGPRIVIVQPRTDGASPAPKVVATEFEIKGVAFDEHDLASVSFAGKPLILTPTLPEDVALVGSNPSANRFSIKVPLDSVGINTFHIVATDKVGNSSSQSVLIERVAADLAVEIVSPALNAETDKTSILIEFKTLFDIASFSISVNLNDIVIDQVPVGKSPGDIISEEIPIGGGYNQVQLTIISKSGDRYSKTLGISRKLSAASIAGAGVGGGGVARARKPGEPQRWAVVVGVSEYANPGIPSLKYADKDAEAFANFLRRPEGGGYDNDHMRMLTNKEATLANVRDALVNFLSGAIDMDLVLIYFAGHGAPEPARPSNLYLLTHDSDPNVLGTTAFPMWQIQDYLARYISAKRIVVLTDACHSGGLSVNYATRGVAATEQNLVNQYLVDLSKSKEGTLVFTASAAGEVSQEFPEYGHGVFTYFMLEGMQGKADFNNDYTITVNEMMQYTEEQVKRKTKGAQNPTRSQTNYDKELTISLINH
jgi:WD40 repeat protein